MSNQPYLHLLCFLLLCLVCSTGCGETYTPGSEKHIRAVTNAVDDDRLIHAKEEPGNWLSYGRTYAEERYSPLNQIHTGNVEQLGLAWSLDLGSNHGIEATPVVVDGILYATGYGSKVFAVDTRTGEFIWSWDPEVPGRYEEIACCGLVNRGVALYKGNVYVGIFDGRLAALDAATGTPVWQTQTVDTTNGYSITGAPRIVDGKVIIGNGGAEFGARGYVSAYDAETGDLVWRTYTVPGDPSKPFESAAMEQAAATWTGEWWKYGGGGTAWDTMVYDPDLNLLYVGTGNGMPWNREYRSPGAGDNLYLASILALAPADGELVWYYQLNPGDTWDYTAAQPIILTDLEMNGINRRVLMQAPKNGFFYILDRETGEFLSAEPFVPVTWAEGIDPETGRPIENPESRYEEEPFKVVPSIFGGHNWHPMAYNPETGLVYIPATEMGNTFGPAPSWEFDPTSINTALQNEIHDDEGIGKLIAWDPAKQEAVWQVLHKSQVNGGTLTTAGGLVFQGAGDGRIVAYDARNGENLWEIQTGTAMIAPPVTYTVDGIQYVTVMAGWGGGFGRNRPPKGPPAEGDNPNRIFTFTLGGDEPVPE